MAAGGRVAVLISVGAQRTDEAVRLTRHAVGLRPDAIVAMTPTFYGMSDAALARYFAAIAAAAPDVPLFMTSRSSRSTASAPACWRRWRGISPRWPV